MNRDSSVKVFRCSSFVFRIEESRLRLGCSSSRCNGGHFFAGGALDPGSLSAQIAQVVETRAANFALADHFNRANRGRVEREYALDADAEANAAYGECGAGSPALLGDHDAF